MGWAVMSWGLGDEAVTTTATLQMRIWGLGTGAPRPGLRGNKQPTQVRLPQPASSPRPPSCRATLQPGAALASRVSAKWSAQEKPCLLIHPSPSIHTSSPPGE